MVKALYGKCQDQEIHFRLNEETGRWETAVPASPNGVYIIELWAEDYAGNIGYFATVEVTFDSSKLCTAFQILEIGERFTMEEVRRTLLGDGLTARPLPDDLAWAVFPDLVMAKVIRCEVCGQ